MSSDNDASDTSAGGHGDVHKNSTDQDSVTSDSDGLVPSDGSHMGSVSVDSIDSDRGVRHYPQGQIHPP